MSESRLLRLEGLTRRDHSTGRVILDDVEMSIDGGERIGLAGPSGSGKSSLLRVIARLDGCDDGRVLFSGVPVFQDRVPRFRRKVVYLPQRPSLFPVSVRDNLKLPFQLSVSDSQYDEAAAVRLLCDLGRPAAMLDQAAESLSGGEQQIIAMIRALVLEPSVLLCDEPTASLDPETSERFEKVVLNWHRKSVAHDGIERAFVWTSHNPQQIKRMTSRVVRMDAGRLLQGESE